MLKPVSSEQAAKWKSQDDDIALDYAEKRIRSVLIELEEKTGKRISHVTVDMRNYVRLNTEIIMEE